MKSSARDSESAHKGPKAPGGGEDTLLDDSVAQATTHELLDSIAAACWTVAAAVTADPDPDTTEGRNARMLYSKVTRGILEERTQGEELLTQALRLLAEMSGELPDGHRLIEPAQVLTGKIRERLTPP